MVLALSIHDLFEGNIKQFTPSRVSRCNALLSRRHRPRGGAETDLGLVPAAGLRLTQVGHLRVSGPQVGQVRGMFYLFYLIALLKSQHP